MSNFEAVIVDPDRLIEFDVRITWEQWSEFGLPRVAANNVEILGARAGFDGMLSAGARNAVWVDLDREQLQAVCVVEFCRVYKNEIDDAVECEFERIHDAVPELACA